MYLKNITLRGFKSFGNMSSLDFDSGISVIVGPNGSGKSNVADAISWVLGEQSPKSLRGTSMGDVIFRSKKQEMGIAEVSLLFDNSDRLFDVEFRDVKITRRVYSEGRSDYFINSSPCRLMDILELIADSGIGKGLHIIINQGQINEVALLKPVERKLIIDEVLGISKHKNRRKKSISKLAKVKDDIGRLDDLLDEIKRTMDPLEVEVKKAREYAEVANEIKKEEISLFLANLALLNDSWEKLEQDYGKLKEKIKETSDNILEIEKGKGTRIGSIGINQSRYERWRTKVESFDSGVNRLYNNIALIESKKNVFSTLYNMFDLEFKNGTVQADASFRMAEEERKKEVLDISFLGNVTKKVEGIKGQFKAYMEKVKIALGRTYKMNELAREVIDEGSMLSDKIVNIIKELKESNAARESDKLGETATEIKKKLEVESKRRKSKSKKIVELKGLCLENLKKSERIRKILKKKGGISEKIKKKLYPEFDRQKSLISKNQQKIEGFNNNISDLKIKENKLDNDLYKIDLMKEQVREKVKDITSSIVDGYNMSIEYATKNFQPSNDMQLTESKVRRFKNTIKQYGSVNPNSAIEFVKIKKRFDFLNVQRQDLVDSRAQLGELIRDVNDKISKVFVENFEAINGNFQKYFKALFPSGEGELILDKNEDISISDEELGVDLKVDIGNNKLVSLSLLSGGEKSLVSMAFLFSVFSLNISPFYVFDEADAALDDVNIGRFQSLVKEFVTRQQIIIITHQKKTMEIAETMYGVTMQSDGISKVVSEKINNGEKAGATKQ